MTRFQKWHVALDLNIFFMAGNFNFRSVKNHDASPCVRDLEWSVRPGLGFVRQHCSCWGQSGGRICSGFSINSLPQDHSGIGEWLTWFWDRDTLRPSGSNRTVDVQFPCDVLAPVKYPMCVTHSCLPPRLLLETLSLFSLLQFQWPLPSNAVALPVPGPVDLFWGLSYLRAVSSPFLKSHLTCHLWGKPFLSRPAEI